MPTWVSTRVDPGMMWGARIGPCHNLPPIHALAFAMGTHSRLGGYNSPTTVVVGDGNQRRKHKTPVHNKKERGCVYVGMPGELVQRVVEACTTWEFPAQKCRSIENRSHETRSLSEKVHGCHILP